jgi:hypothetical protein
MVVVVDLGFRGSTQIINTDPTMWFPVQHPNGSGLVGVDVMLKWVNDHPDDRERSGWDITSQILEEIRPHSRWERLVIACNGPHATEQARALGLQYGESQHPG